MAFTALLLLLVLGAGEGLGASRTPSWRELGWDPGKRGGNGAGGRERGALGCFLRGDWVMPELVALGTLTAGTSPSLLVWPRGAAPQVWLSPAKLGPGDLVVAGAPS